MNQKEIEISFCLIDNGISNYEDVYNRTKRNNWIEKIEELKELKNKILKLEESNIKKELLLSISACLEIEEIEEHNKKNLYITNKEDFIENFLKKIK
jgi:5,10-methylenetetrahydrofolate reductase